MTEVADWGRLLKAVEISKKDKLWNKFKISLGLIGFIYYYSTGCKQV